MHCFLCDADSAAGSKACEVCGKLLATDPDRYFKAGMEAMAAGGIDRSIRLLTDCVSMNPQHMSGRYNLGLALSLGNKHDEAMEQYLAIIEQDPRYPGVYTALGQAAFGSYLAHMEEAEAQRKAMIQLLAKAIDLDPEDVDAHFSLANAYIAIGTADKAIPHLKRALALHPDSSAIHFTIAHAFKMLGKYEEATIMATRAMQLAGTDDPFWEDIRNLLSELEQTVLPR
ncbi:MAG TPA: tetratricopeptide repeat protein [Armatimonadota bacterium]|nr:tetratricopeptide repeat protein [Armatimonadota bacterium]